MSKQDLLKMKTCVLRVNIPCVCEGCKQKIRKTIQKVNGVHSVSVDAEQGRVTVSGNTDPTQLIKKLEKSGKHAEIWGFQSGANKGDKDNKSQKGIKDQQKGSQQPVLHQMNNSKGMKLPQKEQKSVKFNLPEDEFDQSDFDDEEEELGHGHHDLVNKKMPMRGSNGHGLQGEGGPYGKMMPVVSSSNHGPNMHTMNDKKGIGNIGVKLAAKKSSENNENGGKKGGNQKQGGKDKYGGKDVSGLFGKIFGKKSKKKEGSSGKKGSNNEGFSVGNIENNSNGGKKSGGGKYNKDHDMQNSSHETDMINQSKGGKHVKHGGGDNNMGKMDQMGKVGLSGKGPMGQMGNDGFSGKVGQMGPMGHMGSLPAQPGLPAQAMINGGYHPGIGAGNPYQQQQYYQGMGHVNPYNHQQQQQQQQQYMAMMMNQQRSDGNEMFQPMMYSRPPPAVNYAAPSPVEPYHHYFNDENPNSCSIM